LRIYLQDSHWSEYQRFKRLSRLSRLTREKIKIEIGLFFRYLRGMGIKSLVATNEEIIRDYLYYCKTSSYKLTGRKRSVFTIDYKRRLLWNYYEFLYKSRYFPSNPVRNIPPLLTPKRIPVYLSTRQIIRLFKVVVKNKRQPTQFQVRLRAYISLLLFYGMENHEIFRIKLKDIDFRRGIIQIRKTTRHDSRILPLIAPVSGWLEEYLKIRPKRQATNLFQCVKTRSRYTYNSSRGDLRIISRRVRFRVSASILRNTFFSVMINNLVEHRVIQAIVGAHTVKTVIRWSRKNITGKRETTEKYLKGIA